MIVTNEEYSVGQSKCSRRRWILAALAVAPLCYFAFQLLNSPELTSSLNRIIYPVHAIPPWEVRTDDPEWGNIPQMINGAMLAIRASFYTLIFSFPAIKIGFLIGMVVFPVVFMYIGMRPQQVSKATIALVMLASAGCCIGMPLILLILFGLFS